jgi:hypothetical protein
VDAVLESGGPAQPGIHLLKAGARTGERASGVAG